jgi:Carboxypeptidase regulatory-like domain
MRWKEPMIVGNEAFQYRLEPWPAARPMEIENPGYDVTRFNVEFFRKTERMLAHARANNLQVSLIFALDVADKGVDPFGKVNMGNADEQRYYRYCVARFGAAFGQTITGRISGTVRDESRDVVPDANVTVTNDATQIARTAQTDAEGFYVVTNLPPGGYTVAVERSGFKKVVKGGNVLVSDGRVAVDATLETGAVTETVTVTAEADGEQVQNMALNGRFFLQLATLIPGAPLLDFDAIAQTTGGGGTIAINGGRGDSNNLTVDGGFNLLKANNNMPGNNVGVGF